jgi:hypothetical protein
LIKYSDDGTRQRLNELGRVAERVLQASTDARDESFQTSEPLQDRIDERPRRLNHCGTELFGEPCSGFLDNIEL